MADNVAITAGSGTTISTDELAGSVHIQRTKTTFGVGGTATDVSSSDPLPVVQTGTHNVVATNGGTFATQVDGAALTALQLLDNTVYVEDAAAAADPSGNMMMAVRRDTLSASEVSGDGDNIAVKATSKGQIHVLAEMTSAQFQAAGQLTAAASTSVVLASDQATIPVSLASLPTGTVNVAAVAGREYETVAAGQTAQALGATGATGDDIDGVLVIPATTSPGNVLLLDNATSITIFTGGASSVSNLVPFFIPLGMRSVSGAWKITTGSNVSAIGIGNFT